MGVSRLHVSYVCRGGTSQTISYYELLITPGGYSPQGRCCVGWRPVEAGAHLLGIVIESGK